MSTAKKEKTYPLIGLGINLLIIVLEIIGFIIIFRDIGLEAFCYYTVNSNILLFITSIIMCYYYIRIINNKKVKDSKLFSVFRYMSILSVVVTFFVVLTVMAPQYGFFNMIIGGSFFAHHLLCPILGLASFVLFEKYVYSNMDTFRSLYYTLIYSTVLLFLNILKVIEGPYPFLKVYEQHVFVTVFWLIAIIGGAACFSLIIRFLNKKFCLVK